MISLHCLLNWEGPWFAESIFALRPEVFLSPDFLQKKRRDTERENMQSDADWTFCTFHVLIDFFLLFLFNMTHRYRSTVKSRNHTIQTFNLKRKKRYHKWTVKWLEQVHTIRSQWFINLIGLQFSWFLQF